MKTNTNIRPRNWVIFIAAIILGMAIAFGIVWPLTAHADTSCGLNHDQPCNDVLAYFAFNGGTPFVEPYLPDSWSVRYNDNRRVATISAAWYAYGADMVYCTVNGGIYIDPVAVQISARYAITNAVLECAASGRCTLRGTGSIADGTLHRVMGPVYEAMD
jgi:hypothetical protein